MNTHIVDHTPITVKDLIYFLSNVDPEAGIYFTADPGLEPDGVMIIEDHYGATYHIFNDGSKTVYVSKKHGSHKKPGV